MATRISRNRFELIGTSPRGCHTEDEDVKDFVDPVHGPACQQPCARQAANQVFGSIPVAPVFTVNSSETTQRATEVP